MVSFYIPTHDAESWRERLADPQKQWRVGYSARALAYCWTAAEHGFPPEVARVFAESGLAAFAGIEPLLGLVEHKVKMPGRGFPSQTDLFVLAKANDQIVSMVVEGKVDEPLGDRLARWNDGTENKQTRLTAILDMLGLPPTVSGEVRYQLLHRMASAVIEARRFNARSAVMLIHSFSETNRWFADFETFLALYGRKGKIGEPVSLKTVDGLDLYAAWVHGDEKFRES
ncbi:MAG: hypothetical protein KF716_32060 [Anaerolineae bacterium]|nr:hypothetical protein [Anaerolineae bacterium]